MYEGTSQKKCTRHHMIVINKGKLTLD